jgi:hypothetical protein
MWAGFLAPIGEESKYEIKQGFNVFRKNERLSRRLFFGEPRSTGLSQS